MGSWDHTKFPPPNSLDSNCEGYYPKISGKPDSGNLDVRFDEGELEIGLLPLRQLSTLPHFNGVAGIRSGANPMMLNRLLHKEILYLRSLPCAG